MIFFFFHSLRLLCGPSCDAESSTRVIIHYFINDFSFFVLFFSVYVFSLSLAVVHMLLEFAWFLRSFWQTMKLRHLKEFGMRIAMQYYTLRFVIVVVLCIVDSNIFVCVTAYYRLTERCNQNHTKPSL